MILRASHQVAELQRENIEEGEQSVGRGWVQQGSSDTPSR